MKRWQLVPTNGKQMRKASRTSTPTRKRLNCILALNINFVRQMKRIPPNIFMLLFRVAFILFFAYMYQFPFKKLNTGQFSDDPIAFWLLLSVLSIGPIYFIITLLGVLWVTFSKDNTTVVFHSLYKTVRCSFSEIESYHKVTERSNIGTYNGLVIKLKSGKKIKVTTYNVKSIKEVGYFLRSHRIPTSSHGFG